jgi:hypothetical protein
LFYLKNKFRIESLIFLRDTFYFFSLNFLIIMKQLFFCLLCFCNISLGYGQGFQRLLGTRNNDSFSSIIPLTSGDCIVTGTTVRTGNSSDIYITRIDTSGNVIWENTYGGIGNEDNSVSCINSNGNIVIAASSLSYNGGRDLDIFLFEIDTNGVVIWSRNYGKGTNTSRLDEIPRKVTLSPTGLIVCATIGTPGSNSPDVLALEVSNNGRTINWQNQIGITTGFGDIPSSIIPNQSGGYIMVGGSFSSQTSYDQVIWRLNGNGSLRSSIAYGSANNENAQDIRQLSNGDIIVMGNFRNLSGNGLEFSLSSIRPNNTFNWIRTYGDNNNRDERAYGFVQTRNGYTFCGYTNGNSMNDILFVWTDSQGRLLGNASIGGSGKEESSAIVQNSNNSFTIAGVSSSGGAGLDDCYLVRTNSIGGIANNCSTYPIVERSINTNIRSFTYSETNPQLSVTPISIAATLASLSNIGLVCPTLPLELIDFSILFKENGNSLTWISLNEYDLSHFEIEKSSDAINWNRIKSLKSKGGMNVKMKYAFTDYETNEAGFYYRLKQVDYNGDFYYSKIVKSSSNMNEVFVYPNPTKRFLNIKGLGLDENILTSVSIKDLEDKNVLNEEFKVSRAINGELIIDLDKFDLGLYVLSLIYRDNFFYYRIIKE